MTDQVPEAVEVNEPETNGVSHRSIQAKFNNLVDVTETKFHFKKTEDKETGLSSKRPTVVLPIPSPSVEGIVAILENGEDDPKSLELLLDAVQSVIQARARELINEDENITAENFPYDKLSWQAIASMPRAERRGGGIPKETWEEFAQDYIEVMPAVTGKDIDKITKATKLYLAKLTPVKGRKDVLKLLQAQLGLYLSNTENAEQFSDCVEFLTNKIDRMLEVGDEALLENL